MMFTGNLVVTSNPELLNNPNYKVVYVGEQQSIPDSFIRASILLPSYDILECELNGRMDEYAMLYTNYLSFNEGCYNMFATILVALKAGTNIVMYVEEGENLKHMNFIINHFNSAYGISPAINNLNIPMQYNHAFDIPNMTIMFCYLEGFISVDELLLEIAAPHNNINNITEYLMFIESIPFVNPMFGIIKYLQSNNMIPPYEVDPINSVNQYYRQIKFQSQYNNVSKQNLINFSKG